MMAGKLQYRKSGDADWKDAPPEMLELLGVQALVDENLRFRMALRALVGETGMGKYTLSGMYGEETDSTFYCVYCDARHSAFSANSPEHAPDCPIIVGRKLLE